MDSSQVRNALVRDFNHSPFFWRRQFVVLPNSNSFTQWEADLLVCSKVGYITEIEIKVSRQDWRNDKKKDKFKYLSNPEGSRGGWGFIKQFYYAVPMPLAEVWPQMEIPSWAGVYGIHEPTSGRKYGHAVLLKHAEVRPNHRKLTDKQKCEFARLAACRIWS